MADKKNGGNMAWGAKAIDTPANVDTPSPPRNFVKGEFQCPIIANDPGINNSAPSKPNIFARIIVVEPLVTSIIKTFIPRIFDTFFQTFVAPAWWDPTLNTSIPLHFATR